VGCALSAILLFACDRARPGAAPAPIGTNLQPAPARRTEIAIQPAQYPNLGADRDRLALLAAYLEAWNRRVQAPAAVAAARERFLGLYAAVYRAHVTAADDTAGLDQRLRRLWDLSGVAHATALAPAEIKRVSAWTEPPPAVAAAAAPPVVLSALQSTPALVPLERLPDLTRQLLAEVRLDAPDGPLAMALVAGAARAVYLTPQLSGWSPGCPMDVCGSSEPLTRTLILTPVSQVDLAPKPDWSLAAVAVHEAAHLAWFHRAEVSAEARLLLPVPNEREAWRRTAQFLRGLLRSTHPAVRAAAQAHTTDIRTLLQQAHGQLRAANRVLGLPDGDESELTVLSPELSESALRVLPR
jgi:hypothetical protein